MVEYIPPPDPRILIPPLLACLAAACTSPKPPPALLSLLSPILRQRVQILSSISQPSSDSWLQLLCWDSSKAVEVQKIVDATTFEVHPVSGEIEISDDVRITYKRLDSETLRSKLLIDEYDLIVLYVWCSADQEGDGPCWKVAEILPGHSLYEDTATWSETVEEANEYKRLNMLKAASHERDKVYNGVSKSTQPQLVEPEEGEEDDDDYWAQYDNTPGRTPAKRSPALNQARYNGIGPEQNASNSYFARYNEVQPALDNDNPSVNQSGVGESTLSGNVLGSVFQRQSEELLAEQRSAAPLYQNGNHPTDSRLPLNHPRPSSASSGGSETVSKLEKTAEYQSVSEMGVKHHISSNIKSLFRLARATGLSKAEFDALVRRELDCLSLMDIDDADEDDDGRGV
ncbi:hypothetical protein PAAG_04724 [Paracoccidioides lutzii Pb01]|uniref:Uncharacterized protein n=1 Tax=Paracoccidioides lutzii (strain ATCC MYA-826 / Pb01) TaxID=502779 RepID=C1H295_PARBA|nr:hypothetical protein PAAG_04724 [Paracoccidioides lutzii Pb01]EEH33675.2 hypothetical protein PAAG_04724 [Paracoccidioides lutzii Pb01]